MMISFAVPGEPKAKARPRLTRDGHAYTPKSTRLYEHAILEAFHQTTGCAYERAPAFPDGVPVRLTVLVYHGMPKGASRARRDRMRSGLEACTKRPDLDNVVKSVSDALNGVAYADDRQIVWLTASKRWAEQPRVEVEVAEVK